MGLSCFLCWCLHTNSVTHWKPKLSVCFSILQFLSLKSMENVYRLWKWMAFCFDLVSCSLFASWFGVMTITLKRKCICASPLSSLFLWPFKIDTPCCSLHFTAHCIWWWWWWCICSGGCDWWNSFMLCYTITWFYCQIFMSLKLCQSLCLHLCFFLLKNLLFISPSPWSIVFPLSLCLFFWLASLFTLLSLAYSPSFSVFLSLSAVLIVTQLSGCQF